MVTGISARPTTRSINAPGQGNGETPTPRTTDEVPFSTRQVATDPTETVEVPTTDVSQTSTPALASLTSSSSSVYVSSTASSSTAPATSNSYSTTSVVITTAASSQVLSTQPAASSPPGILTTPAPPVIVMPTPSTIFWTITRTAPEYTGAVTYWSIVASTIMPVPAAQTGAPTFAPISIQLPTTITTTASPTYTPDPSAADTGSHLAVGPIVGGATGGVAFIGLLAACVICARRKSHRRDGGKPLSGPPPLGASATAVDVREEDEDMREGPRRQDAMGSGARLLEGNRRQDPMGADARLLQPQQQQQQLSESSHAATGSASGATPSLLATGLMGDPSARTSGASTPQALAPSTATDIAPQSRFSQQQMRFASPSQATFQHQQQYQQQQRLASPSLSDSLQPQQQPLPLLMPLGAGSSKHSSATSSQNQEQEPHQPRQQQPLPQPQQQQRLHPSSAAASRLSSTTTAGPQRLSTAGSSSAAGASSQTSGPSSALGRLGSSSTNNDDDDSNNDDTPDNPPPAYETLASPRSSSASSSAAAAPAPPPRLVAQGIPGKQGFIPSAPDEIPLQNGDEVQILRLFSDGWCRVRNASAGGAVGMVPAKFVVAEPAARRASVVGGGDKAGEGAAAAGPSQMMPVEDDLEQLPRDVKRGYADPYRPASSG
ncbi:hypothetical protein HDU88_008577 [Geranomyces variabilis]|nr:hypothetical protein HDU88_008577 [Geranomyces variabilis]